MQQDPIRFGEFLANMQMSIMTASRQQLGPEWSFHDRVYDYNLLYYATSGLFHVELDPIPPFTVHPGQLLLIPAGRRFSVYAGADSFSKYYCHFTAAIGDQSVFELLELFPLLEVEEPALLERQFALLLRYGAERSMTAGLRRKAVLYDILCMFIEQNRHCRLQRADSPLMEQMKKVLQAMEANLADKMTVERLAALVHLHPHYFNDVFKTMMGCPPMQYLTRLRYERACLLLSTTSRTVSDIAEAVGIAPDYFPKFFKNHAGVSPSAYRQQS